jgi:hypothetical protein
MSEESGEGFALGFVSRFHSIFHSPEKVFADVDKGAPWWEPWVWASLVNMLVAYVVLPIEIHLYRLNLRGIPEDQIAQTIENMQRFPMKYMGVVTAPITVILVAAVFAGISFLAVSVLSERADFKKHLTICLFASIISSVGVLLSNIVIRWRGIENIRSLEDATATFGPAAFIPEGHKIWYAVLSTFDVFSIWFYVVMWIGVIHVFRLSRLSGLLVVVPVWLLSVLIALVFARFGGTM